MIETTANLVSIRHEVVALTPSGAAACRLSEFQDCWNELTTADRAWFREWLADIFASAFVEEPRPTG